MLDVDLIVHCEHDRDPGECPICSAVDKPVFDPFAWVDALASPRADLVVDQVGVPLS